MQGSYGEGEATEMDTSEPDIEPVGQDYIEELKSEDGKFKNYTESFVFYAMMNMARVLKPFAFDVNGTGGNYV